MRAYMCPKPQNSLIFGTACSFEKSDFGVWHRNLALLREPWTRCLRSFRLNLRAICVGRDVDLGCKHGSCQDAPCHRALGRRDESPIPGVWSTFSPISVIDDASRARDHNHQFSLRNHELGRIVNVNNVSVIRLVNNNIFMITLTLPSLRYGFHFHWNLFWPSIRCF